MTTTIEVDSSLLEKPTKADHLNFLPCDVAEDVPNLPVEARFTSFTVNQGNGKLTNQLRGRPLDGAVTPLPDGYTGVVVEGRQGLLADQDKTLRATASFSAFTMWNYDKKLSEDDAWSKAAKWTEVAAALHGN